MSLHRNQSTPRPACRRLHPHRPGDDVMLPATATLHGGPVVFRPIRATPCFILHANCINFDKIYLYVLPIISFSYVQYIKQFHVHCIFADKMLITVCFQQLYARQFKMDFSATQSMVSGSKTVPSLILFTFLLLITKSYLISVIRLCTQNYEI